MANYSSIFLIFFIAFVSVCQAKCPSTWDSPRKDIVCYYSGKQAAASLDACLCTHLVYNNIGINQNKNVELNNDVVNDFETFRSRNPSIKVIASLGGESLNAETFSSLITEKESLENLTSSINSLYTDGIIHGVEINWEWPVQVGGKKDRIKLIRYARQIKIAVGEEVTPRKPRQRDIHKRSAEDEATTIVGLDERSQPDEVTTHSSLDNINPNFQNKSLPESSSSKKSDPKGESGFILEPETTSIRTTPTTTIHSRINSRTRQTTLSTHSRQRGLSPESRLAKPRTRESFKINPFKARQPVIPSLADDDELDLIDLEEDDLALDLNKKTEGFTLFLRLPSIPEYLVQGYDFSLLNKFVDYYTLSTNNLTGFQNVTYHHSRLMGVADVENADSLLDVITSLGADERKLILTATSFGNKFSLLDAERTLPGASTSGRIETITYQQVCQTLKHGNWTVERDEDLTAPYGFNDKMWMAFDDATSLLIKTKYALIRNLGGMALDAIEADDIDNICGHGEQSLLKTIRKTLTQLERKTRQSIVHSLEEDLIASPQTLSPVVSSGINVSPFRIVRIVDREGQITGLRQNSETTLECTRQGYYRNPEDCSLFYRCVKFNQYEDDYTIFEYGCPAGLVFDERWEVCVWPSQAAPCDGSSEIRPVPRNPYVCNAEGYFVDPENCRWFFACFDHKGDGTFTHYEFRCPFGLGFDEANLICNWPWLVPGCGGTPGSGSADRAGKLLRPDLNRGINRQPGRQEKAFNRGNGGQRPALNVNGDNPLGLDNGGDPFLNSFKSQNPARQSTLSAGFAPTTPGFATSGSPFPSGAIFGEIASDNCDNCESQGIRINGHGDLAGSGIEVVRTGGFPSSTPLADDGSYLYPVPENPLVLPSKKPTIEIGLVTAAPIISSSPDVRPAEIELGFKPLFGVADSQIPRKPFAVSGFNDGNAAFVPAFTTPRSPAHFAVQDQGEVASVIPSGFTSATLSNGPNSVDNRLPLGNRNPGNTFFNAANSPVESGVQFSAGQLNSNANRFSGSNGNAPSGLPAGGFGNGNNQNGAFGIGAQGNGRPLGNQGLNAPRGNNANGGSGNGGFNGPAGNGGFNGPAGNGGFNGPSGNGGFNGPPGNGGQAGRGGREFSQFKGTVPPQQPLQPSPNSFTAVTRPLHKQPAVISKFKGTDWNKFGPGGFRTFNDTIGPEVCERPGLFRHPTDCDKFYECFYDKWIDKFTVHVFPCPIVLGYDTGITACNWPFDGPQCQQNV